MNILDDSEVISNLLKVAGLKPFESFLPEIVNDFTKDLFSIEICRTELSSELRPFNNRLYVFQIFLGHVFELIL